MCWLYRYRFYKHWILYAITKDIIHIYECEHYFHSKVYMDILNKRYEKQKKRKNSNR